MGSPRGFQSRFAVLADGDTTITCWVAGTFRWTGASCEAQASVLAHPPSWLHNPRSLLRWLRCGDVVPFRSCDCPFRGSRAFVRACAETIAPRIHPPRLGPRGLPRWLVALWVSGTFRSPSLDPRRLGMARPPPGLREVEGLEHALRRSFEPSGTHCSSGTLFTCDVCATRSWVAH